MMQSIADKIVKRIRGHGRGWVFSTKDFFDLGDRYAVNMALHRLQKEGVIRRIMHGIYDFPRWSKLLNEPGSPNSFEVISTIARINGWVISPSGETALNFLGLSRQVPAKFRYFSDGPSKKYAFCGGDLVFAHRATKETGRLSNRTALVVQALKALGKENVGEREIAILRKELTKKDLQNALKEMQVATNWVYNVLKRIAGEEKQGG